MRLIPQQIHQQYHFSIHPDNPQLRLPPIQEQLVSRKEGCSEFHQSATYKNFNNKALNYNSRPLHENNKNNLETYYYEDPELRDKIPDSQVSGRTMERNTNDAGLLYLNPRSAARSTSPGESTSKIDFGDMIFEDQQRLLSPLLYPEIRATKSRSVPTTAISCLNEECHHRERFSAVLAAVCESNVKN